MNTTARPIETGDLVKIIGGGWESTDPTYDVTGIVRGISFKLRVELGDGEVRPGQQRSMIFVSESEVELVGL